MDRKLDRREFLIYGSAMLGTSLAIKVTQSEAVSIDRNSALKPSIAPNTIEVGLVYAQTGFMAVADRGFATAHNLAIDSINKSGGILGRQIVAISEDSESNWQILQQKTEKLIQQDRVATVFSCWTSGRGASCLDIHRYRFNNLKDKNLKLIEARSNDDRTNMMLESAFTSIDRWKHDFELRFG